MGATAQREHVRNNRNSRQNKQLQKAIAHCILLQANLHIHQLSMTPLTITWEMVFLLDTITITAVRCVTATVNPGYLSLMFDNLKEFLQNILPKLPSLHVRIFPLKIQFSSNHNKL